MLARWLIFEEEAGPSAEGNRKTPISHWPPLLSSGNNRVILGASGWGRISPLGERPRFPQGSDIQNQVEVPSGASKAAEGRQRKFQVPSLLPSQEPCHPTFFSGVSQTDVRWVGLWLSGSRVVSYVLAQQQGLWKLMVLPKFTQSPRALGCPPK